MNWQEVVAILVPLFGLLGWIYNRIEKKADERFKLIMDDLKCVKEQLHSLDMRLTRLEGRFDERGYWESREFHKTGTEDKK